MTLLTMEGVYKRYGGVQALKNASLSVNAAEVHGLLGPNGSGKSTLNKVLAGTVRPDQARIAIDGKPVTIDRPLDAYKHRVSAVYQQLSLVPDLSVAENLLLGTELTRGPFVNNRDGRLYAEAAIEPFLSGLDTGFSLDKKVATLSPGSQQLVEVAKAMARKPKILVLDEATASLRRDQVELVFSQVRRIVSDGVSVVFVSHRLEEITTLCERATIVRNGETVATVSLADTSEQDLVRLMVGDEAFTPSQEGRRTDEIEGKPVLTVRGLSAPGVRDVSIEVRRGEIVGLGGLQGMGQSELLHALFADIPRKSGEIAIDESSVKTTNVRSAIRAGFALVPGDRGTQGLLMVRPIQENLSIASLKKRLVAGLFISMKSERKAADNEVKQLNIKIGELSDAVSSLSGGNQQKVVIGKWLLNKPRVVLLDDPTKGVDIGSKAEIYSIIRDLASQGVGIVLNSSDDKELLELCDRVLVMYEGKVVDELSGDSVTQDNLVAAALRVGDKEGDDGQEN